MTEALEELGNPDTWRFHSSQIATLTDHQVLNFYIRPAVKRAEAARKQAGVPGGSAPLPAPPVETPPARAEPAKVCDQPPPKQMILGMYLSSGYSREYAEKEYDKQMIAWRERKRKEG